jgi:hypothetical protein
MPITQCRRLNVLKFKNNLRIRVWGIFVVLGEAQKK